jgi:hypothetical protein
LGLQAPNTPATKRIVGTVGGLFFNAVSPGGLR